MRPPRSEILGLLAEIGAPEEVISHSRRVAAVALSLARGVDSNGMEVDLWLVEAGSLIHDIGRTKTHSIRHGIEGAKIIMDNARCREMFNREDREALAYICERHIGGGVPAGDARMIGLPPGNYMPTRVEEKIIAHADNLVWNGVLTFEEGLRAFEEKFGKKSTIVGRIKALGTEVERMASGAIERNHDT